MKHKSAQGFEFLEHMADIKVRVWARTKAALFEQAARAVSAYAASQARVHKRLTTRVEISGADDNALLYQFLDELLYLLDAERFLIAAAKVELPAEGVLRATLHGDIAKNYEVQHIKAATYADMRIEKKGNAWEAVFVLDV